MAQLGTQEDEAKPRFASLQSGQSLETITLEDALELFKLPKVIGQYEGEDLLVATGRFGPYVRHAGKFYSLPEGLDPLSCTADQAIELIQTKRQAEQQSLLRSFDEDPDLEIRTGRFGPYIKYKGSNYKLPKDSDIPSLSYAACLELIQTSGSKPTRKGSSRARSSSTTRRRKS